MNYTVEIGSGVMIYIQSFVMIGLAIQKLIRGIYSDTQIARRSHKPALFFQNNESRIKISIEEKKDITYINKKN
jgi:hypothetical protein